jgi:hypothetical protein
MKSSFDLLFSPFKEVEFADVILDFSLDPDHFIEWLKTEDDDINDCYAYNVSKNCEFSCLYIAMLLSGKKLQSEPLIYYGGFGFWEHYWVGYTFNGVEYFIDLTLQQFMKTAPKVAISIAQNDDTGYHWLSEGEPISKYLQRQRAFEFYTDPITMCKPQNN